MHSPAPEDSPFFARLAGWAHTPRALERFDEMLARPLEDAPAAFQFRLYRALIDFLLDALKLPHSRGAEAWEFRPLYRFGRDVDPHYFTEGNIRSLLNHWPLIDPERRQQIASVLTGFFQLRRQGFPEKYPSPFLPNTECEQWVRIFPAHLAWRSLDVLRRVGLMPMASREGFRVYTRFAEGRFAPPSHPDQIRRWQAECWRAGGFFTRDGDDPQAPYRANFVAAVFAGRFASMGIPGVCGELPDCDDCPLRGECRWVSAPPGERAQGSEVLAAAARNSFRHVRTDRLLQTLLGLEDGDAERLRAQLAGTSLRKLAEGGPAELRERFGFAAGLPERLGVLFEAARRFNEEPMAVGGPLVTAWEVFSHFRMRLRDDKQEQFIVVLLDKKRRYLDDRIITRGTLDASPVHPREVFNAAIRESAAALIVVHNHPSGDPTPSREDIEITRNLLQVGEMVGIPVLDHLIIADDRYISLLEEGLLKF